MGYIFGKVIESVTRQPEMRDEITSIQWLGFALTEAIVFYAFIFGLIAFFLSDDGARSSSPPKAAATSSSRPSVGLMIWTLIAFGVTFFMLRSSRSRASRRRSTARRRRSRIDRAAERKRA